MYNNAGKNLRRLASSGFIWSFICLLLLDTILYFVLSYIFQLRQWALILWLVILVVGGVGLYIRNLRIATIGDIGDTLNAHTRTMWQMSNLLREINEQQETFLRINEALCAETDRRSKEGEA